MGSQTTFPTRLELCSSRRTDLSRQLFVGRSAGDLLDTVPLVLSICATARATAAVRAYEQSAGVRPPSEQDGEDLRHVKQVIRNLNHLYARQLLNRTPRMEDAGEVRHLLTDVLDQTGRGGLIRAGR